MEKILSSEIRRAKNEDLPKLNQIAWEAKQYWGYPASWMEAWKEDLSFSTDDLQRFSTFVICKKKSVEGFCAIQANEHDYEIMHLWILPENIGQGLGRKLLRRSLAETTLEEKPIFVLADPNAEEFYKKEGFITIELKESLPKGRFLPFMKRS